MQLCVIQPQQLRTCGSTGHTWVTTIGVAVWQQHLPVSTLPALRDRVQGSCRSELSCTLHTCPPPSPTYTQVLTTTEELRQLLEVRVREATAGAAAGGADQLAALRKELAGSLEAGLAQVGCAGAGGSCLPRHSCTQAVLSEGSGMPLSQEYRSAVRHACHGAMTTQCTCPELSAPVAPLVTSGHSSIHCCCGHCCAHQPTGPAGCHSNTGVSPVLQPQERAASSAASEQVGRQLGERLEAGLREAAACTEACEGRLAAAVEGLGARLQGEGEGLPGGGGGGG